MNNNLKATATSLTLLILIGGCVTTTDARECADSGIFAVTCEGQVAAETERRNEELADRLIEADSLESELLAKQKQQEELQSRVDMLKADLETQQDELATLRSSLSAQLENNRITKAEYDGHVAELDSLNEKIANYQSIETDVFSEETAFEAAALSQSVSDFTERLREGGLG